jgi:1-acyl-sn-glycerol-3-phosphate acyltransferase
VAVVRAVAFNLLFFSWTAVAVLFGLPALLFGRDGVFFMARLWARGAFWLLAVVVGLHHRVLGLERLPPAPLIVAIKHQSSWDIAAGALLFEQPAFVLKRELTWIPFFGLYLLLGGMIPIDRQAGGSALRSLLRRGRRAAEAGQSVVIFPEGTRTPPGTRRPYQPGVAGLYDHLRLPVAPVALNSGLFWGRRSFIKRPGTITIEILEPIPPGLERRVFLEELERRLETASARLAEAAAPEAEKSSGRLVEKIVESVAAQGPAHRKNNRDKC